MKGIVVCCDGEKSLKKELSQLESRKKEQVKKSKNKLFSILKLFSNKPISKLETKGR